MSLSLAVKYRPKTWKDVTEQGNTIQILQQQIASNEIKHGYLFCGGAGTGKTTCARIFANEINDGKGTPIEMDAASHNSVDDIRDIGQQARMVPLEGQYKVFIIDECHSLSNSAWQAMLKLLEEPPTTAIFIFATTDPQKIPKTILSRVQRYDFQRISQDGICKRLYQILQMEDIDCNPHLTEAVEYIAKIADGGMRDAITMLDKCLSFSTELTLENVVSALGVVDYEQMFDLTSSLLEHKAKEMLETIDTIHSSGKDLRQFVRNYTNFVLDLCKFDVTRSFRFLYIPQTYREVLDSYSDDTYVRCKALLDVLLKLNTNIKWDNSPRAMVEAALFQFCVEE